jgi:hypothetical protein
VASGGERLKGRRLPVSSLQSSLEMRNREHQNPARPHRRSGNPMTFRPPITHGLLAFPGGLAGKTMKHTLLLLGLAFCAACPVPAAGSLPTSYDVVWTSQSTTSRDSMPLAGGVLGLNVWVENNDLLVLIGSPDCMDEQGMQTKLGLIRLRFEPVAFAADFRQELNLGRSEMVISGRTATGKAAAVRLWAEVFQTVVHAEVTAEEPLGLTASYETWANYDAKEVAGGWQWVRRLAPVNQRRLHDLTAQGLADFAASAPDPLSNLTAGGRLTGAGLVPAGTGTGKFNGMATRTWSLKTTKPVTRLDLRIPIRMAQDPSLEEWERQLGQMPAADRETSLAWWREFWDRSHIFIKPGATPEDAAWQAGRNYQLARYQLAANRNGRAMTLFNGGVFPCTGNPDQRNWDGCQFMGQNQRLVYWPLLKSGDFDLLQVATDFYRDRTELRRQHAKRFWGVNGVTYPEPFSIFGLDAIGTTKDGRSKPDHLHYHYTSGMEFALMMLYRASFSGCDVRPYLPAAEGIITYYDAYYQKCHRGKTGRPLDANGRLVIYPSDACEPYHGCTNNTDVIAGLARLASELLALPAGILPPERIAYLKGFQQRLPEYPMKEQHSRRYFAAAESWEWVFENGNMDFPQMYICFPFDAVFLGRSDMSLALNTWQLSAIKPAVQHQNQCWYQSAVNLARMGETEQAAKHTVAKLLHPGARFPTFYRTFYANSSRDFCHLPDTDHGGTAMIALQEMLMQTDGRRILLGPAWPAGWDCDFKLHAPLQTTVAGRVTDGRVVIDKVTPESRRADITIYPLKETPMPLSQGKPATASSVWHQPGYDPAKAVDGDSSTRWAVANGQLTGWLEVDLGQPSAVSRAVIEEISWPAITKFAIEAMTPAGQWQAVATGTAIGARLEVRFPAVTAHRFRLNLIEASGMPNIEEFQLFTN